MKQVSSYRTDDGKLFTEKEEAVDHEFEISVRGFFNTFNSSPVNINVKGFPEKAIRKNPDDLYEIMQKYRRSKAQFKKSKKKEVAS